MRCNLEVNPDNINTERRQAIPAFQKHLFRVSVMRELLSYSVVPAVFPKYHMV